MLDFACFAPKHIKQEADAQQDRQKLDECVRLEMLLCSSCSVHTVALTLKEFVWRTKVNTVSIFSGNLMPTQAFLPPTLRHMHNYNSNAGSKET